MDLSTEMNTNGTLNATNTDTSILDLVVGSNIEEDNAINLSLGQNIQPVNIQGQALINLPNLDNSQVNIPRVQISSKECNEQPVNVQDQALINLPNLDNSPVNIPSVQISSKECNEQPVNVQDQALINLPNLDNSQVNIPGVQISNKECNEQDESVKNLTNSETEGTEPEAIQEKNAKNEINQNTDNEDWQSLFFMQHDEHSGAVKTLNQALDLIQRYSIASGTSYVVWNSAYKDFGNAVFDKKKNYKVMWQEDIPFIFVNSKSYVCEFSRRQHKSKSRQEIVKKYRKLTESKKVGCEAFIRLKERLVFPDFKLKDGQRTKYYRRLTNVNLKQALMTDTANGTREIFVTLPHPSSHNHKTGEIKRTKNLISKRYIQEIDRLVKEGVHDVEELESHLHKSFSGTPNTEIDVPDNDNATTALDISQEQITDHALLIQNRVLYTNNDQQKLSNLIEQWKEKYKNGNFFCRTRKASVRNIETEKFICVMQTEKQRHLLEKYGAICILDPIFKTLRFPIPIYFLCVKTNFSYQVVSIFITQNATLLEINEALAMIKDWNKNWQPNYIFTDLSDKHINAISEILKVDDNNIYVSDFHRDHAWRKWLSDVDNGIDTAQQNIMALLTNIANSLTEEDFHKALIQLQLDVTWKENDKFQHWFTSTWFPQHKRWVWACRNLSCQILLKINDGLKLEKEQLRYPYLRKHKWSSVNGFCQLMVEEYIPECYNRYVTENHNGSYKVIISQSSLSLFLKNRPSYFIKHCLERYAIAQTFAPESVSEIGEHVFEVKDLQRPFLSQKFTVHLNKEECPSCTCDEWKENFLLCEHIFAVIVHSSKYSLEDISTDYKNSPYLFIDDTIVPSICQKLDIISNPMLKMPISSQSTSTTPQNLSVQLANSNNASNVLICLPPTAHDLNVMRNECRNYLSQISSLVRFVRNKERLQSLHSQFESTLKNLQETTANDTKTAVEQLIAKNVEILSNSALGRNLKRGSDSKNDDTPSSKVKNN